MAEKVLNCSRKLNIIKLLNQITNYGQIFVDKLILDIFNYNWSILI